MATKNNMTKAWEYYELGRTYNNSLLPNQYDLVNTNIEFFTGNQWIHLNETPASRRLPKPVFNIIKRITSLFVSSLTSSAVTVSFDPLTYYDGENLDDPGSNAAVFATAEVQNLFEKFKMEYRIRDALFDGAQTGDYCAHFYWDPDAIPYGGAFGPYAGEIRMEMVDGVNVMFGNPNDDDVESQPYILIIGRDTVDNLREELIRAKDDPRMKPDASKEDEWLLNTEYSQNPDLIQPDRDYVWQAALGGKRELISDDDASGKALYVYMYTKKKHEEDVIDPKTGEVMMEPKRDKHGEIVYELDANRSPIVGMDGKPIPKMQKMRRVVETVHVTKATKSAVIYEDVDTGLSRYPIAWGNWERQKNQYHGRALVTGIVPNQIFINTMFALVMKHLQLQSLPKTLYNADLIAQWDNDVGKAIGVHNLQPGQNIDQVATSMKPAEMSSQIIGAIDKAIQLTRDCLGATDAQMGKVRPDNTSALMVLQSAAEVPLENTRALLYEWVEDIGAILLDMMGTYYGKRPLLRDRPMQDLVMDPVTGKPKMDEATGMMQSKGTSHRVMEEFDFSQLKHLYLNLRVNVGATTYFSEIAMVQTLDNLRRDGTLEVIDYLERLPDRLIPRKNDLIESIKERAAAEQAAKAQQMAAQQAPPQIPGAANPNTPPGGVQRMGGPGIPGSNSQMSRMITNPNIAAGGKAQMKPTAVNPTIGGPLDKEKTIANLPANKQAEYPNLPKAAQRALTKMQALRNTQ